MSVADTIALDLAIYGFGWGVGWWAKGCRTIDYKKRWKEALALLDKEKLASAELATVDAPKQIAKTTSLTDYQKRLLRMGASARYDEENDRLFNGQDPVDTLDGLTDTWFVKFKKNRRFYGYDD